LVGIKQKNKETLDKVTLYFRLKLR